MVICAAGSVIVKIVERLDVGNFFSLIVAGSRLVCPVSLFCKVIEKVSKMKRKNNIIN